MVEKCYNCSTKITIIKSCRFVDYNCSTIVKYKSTKKYNCTTKSTIVKYKGNFMFFVSLNIFFTLFHLRVFWVIK